jgi:uncharacterized protein (TIGR03086 family)
MRPPATLEGEHVTLESAPISTVDNPPDLRALHECACHHFVEYVERVRPEQWEAPTPCTDWNVRALVDHVIRWNTLVPEFLAGHTLDEMDAPFERDILGDDPVAAARDSVGMSIVAFAAPDALERTIHHLIGDIPGSHAIFLRLLDNVVHGWDLATALGLDYRMDPTALGALYAACDAQRAQIRASGAFGAHEIDVPSDADMQLRLLGLLGR